MWTAPPKREGLFYELFVNARPHVEVVQWFQRRGLVHEYIAPEPVRKSFCELVLGVRTSRDGDCRGEYECAEQQAGGKGGSQM